MPKQYAQRDIEEQKHYMRHLDAMTRENLHSKSAIAAELAHRDEIIDNLAISGPGVKDHKGGVVIQFKKRSEQLESIADSINLLMNYTEGLNAAPIGLDASDVHKINGWMEQLRIIADELKGAGK